MSWMQDLRYAFRLLVKDRGFTAVAVLALALGIGMNTTVFTFVNAVLIRGLPFQDSHQLFHIDMRNTSTGDEFASPWPQLEEWRAQTKTFSGLEGFRSSSMNVTEATRPPERVSGALVTPNMFGLLRQQPALGRDFRDEDGRKNAEPVVMLGYTLWKNRYGSDPKVIGQTIKINETASTIIGVMPDGMRFPNNNDMWQPLIPNAAMEKRDYRGIRILGRLAPGSTRAQAQAELSGFAKALQTQYPQTNKDIDVQVLTFNERFNGGPIRIVFLTLLGAVGFVLLIACLNVANLLLARSTTRGREIAIRFALGASRRRVIRQLLIESVLLAFIGGVLGLFLAYGGIRAFDAAVADAGKPYWIVFSMDFMVFGYMAAICLTTGIVFGLAPALQVSKTNTNEILKEGGRGAGGGRRAQWMRSVLVIGELALTVVLLVGAGLMVRSFLKLYSLELGVDSDHVLTMRADLPVKKYETPEKQRQAFDAMLAKITAVPGVRNVSLADTIPMGGTGSRAIEFEGKPNPPGVAAPQVSMIAITPDYFATMTTTMRRGRQFGENDGAPGSESVIVNERFVARFFPGEDPVGRRLRVVAGANSKEPADVWRTIVGVSPTIRQGNPQSLEPDAVIYTPYRQRPSSSMAILVRSDGNPTALTPQIRQAVQAADPDQAVFNVRSLNDTLANMRWPFRVFGSMFAIFALVALALSAVGIYAVTSYSVTQRTPEIGVRMALGARPAQVWWMVLRQGIVQLAIGLAIGVGAGVPLSGVLKTLVVQIPSRDPVTFGFTVALLALVMLGACIIPARRATKLDPSSALRAE